MFSYRLVSYGLLVVFLLIDLFWAGRLFEQENEFDRLASPPDPDAASLDYAIADMPSPAP